MKRLRSHRGREHLAPIGVVLLAWFFCARSQAQPTILSTVPPNGATGLPPSTTLVITFSEAMNVNVTVAYLVDATTLGIVPITSAWSAGNTVLTCTPNATLPNNRGIYWTVMNGQNPAGSPLIGTTGGIFTTAGSLVLTNAAWSPGGFSFDILSAAGQSFSVEYSTTLRSNEWQTLVTTNSPTGVLHLSDPESTSHVRRFYRARGAS